MPDPRVTVGLVQACDDKRLLNFGLWPMQRRLLEAVERGPRIHVWCLGRRSAKTTTAAIVGLHSCLFNPALDKRVRRGEKRYAVAVAVNIRQARLFTDSARSIVKASPMLSRMVESETEDQIAFKNGSVLAAFPCSSRGGRGWPIHTLVLDEAAHFTSETEGSTTAERVWESLTPATAQFADDARIIVSSTPFGESGLFAQLFQQAASGELADAIAQRATTAAANPTISDEFLEAERARDPESFRGEYEAEFIASGGAFLDWEKIQDAVIDRGELLPHQGRGWIAGIDPAFSSDPFGLCIVGRDLDDRHRLVLALAKAWKPSRHKHAGFEQRRAVEDETLAEVAGYCRRFKCDAVTDQYAAPQVIERLRAHGVHVSARTMTASSKTAAFGELRARLNAGLLELYSEPELLSELRRLRTKYAAGQSSVVNPRVGGSHGSRAQALALAVLEHADGGPWTWPADWMQKAKEVPMAHR